MSSARIAEIVLGGERAPWERLGLAFVSGVAQVGAVGIRVVPFLSPGIQTVGLWHDPDEAPDRHHDHDGECDHDHGPRPSFVDGAPVHVVTSPGAGAVTSAESAGVLDARVIDHVVLMTPDLERTCGAASRATGAPLKRIR